MKTTIQLYGVNSSKFEYTKALLRKALDKADIDYDFEEIKNVDRFISDGIESIPAVKLNNHVAFQAGEFDDIHDFISSAAQSILKSENFGQMKKIVVPTDFSPSAEVAFQYAKEIAIPLNAMIRIVHAFHPSPIDHNGVVYVDPEMEKYKRQKLESFTKAVQEKWMGDANSDLIVESEFVIGFPVQAIVDISKDGKADLIIMGTKGENAALRSLFGSVSSDVARGAHCPVMLIPPDVKYQKVRNILYASNDPNLDSQLMDLTIYFGNAFDATVHLVHVDKDHENYPQFDLLRIWQEKFPKNRIKHALISDSNLWNGLESYAQENDIDLIVMCTRHRNFWQRFIHTSSVKELALNTKYPLLVLHKEDKM